jgi:hypothetical protein
LRLNNSKEKDQLDVREIYEKIGRCRGDEIGMKITLKEGSKEIRFLADSFSLTPVNDIGRSFPCGKAFEGTPTDGSREVFYFRDIELVEELD